MNNVNPHEIGLGEGIEGRIQDVLFLILTISLFRKELKKLNLSHILPIGIMGIFSTITEFTANVAYGTNVGVTSLIMNTPF